MRNLGILLLAPIFFLVGCAKDLPYSFSINQDGSTNGCAISLQKIVNNLSLKEKSINGSLTIKKVQESFEDSLGRRVESLSCPHSTTSPGQPPVKSVSSKWLVTYTFEPTDPDQSMERFEEYLNSMKAVKSLTEKPIPIKADSRSTGASYDPIFEEPADKKAQWFGDREVPETNIFNIVSQQINQKLPIQLMEAKETEKECHRCVLYKIVTEPPPGLYDRLLTIANEINKNKDRRRRIVVLGYEIPWDEDKTLIRYGVAFYFEDRNDGAQSNGHVTDYIGYDLVYANEATPAPYEPEQLRNEKPLSVINPKNLDWDARLWGWTGYPFFVAIGIKNAAFELAKIPISFVAGALFGRDSAIQYPLQNIRTAYNALEFEVATEPRMTGKAWDIIVGPYRLFTEIPLVGHLFQYNFGADARFGGHKDASAPREKIFLSRGIYGGNKWGQDTALWVATTREAYPDYDIYSPPYRHGTVADVVWSMFNLSHGPAYNEALYIKGHAGTADRLYLAGHSGGVQRSAAASRILWFHGYSVKKVVGIAGPSVGQAFVDLRYPDGFKVYLNSQAGANQDVVSQVGSAAQAFSSAVGFVIRLPLVYVPEIFCPKVIVAKFCEKFSTTMDRIGPSNARVYEAERKPSSLHNTPFRLSLTERVVFDAFIRSEFSTAFRDDLERPSDPKGEDPTGHAFPWKP